MKTLSYFPRLRFLFIILAFIQNSGEAYATHAQSADITYQCLGGNQYQISVSFYRDCAGINAPNTVDVNLFSASCNQDFNITLNQNSGSEVSLVCNSVNTSCTGGNYPGVEEYIYQQIVTLPAQCNDWVFSFALCCRNNAINTIDDPGNEDIYVEAHLNSLNAPCNSSPTFSNPPVSYPCVGQTSCFNHGAYDSDGDSLYYSMLAPATGPNTTVTYLPGYSATQPLNSNPLVSFNPNTGDICVTPTMQEVTVLAVRVEEWRNGVLIGSVIRDIQLRTIACNNNLPEISGINGTGQYTATACAGSNLSFNIVSNDLDAGQNVTLTWNGSIPGASFTTNGGQFETATFSWTPTVNNISSTPYCFTVNVADDNCPITGVQVYSFCITVTGFDINTTSTPANCGASNGSASVTPLGGTAPYTYQWLPNGGNNANANGLTAGNYTVNVTDINGCTATNMVTVGTGGVPGNISTVSTPVSCYGGNDGTATVTVNGGQQPYTYLWSNGGGANSISNLSAGTYYVQVTTNNGCITSDSIIVIQPQEPLSITSITSSVSCNGDNNGAAIGLANGGTAPYTYSWNTVPVQTTNTAMGLSAGNYLVTVIDAHGCQAVEEVNINEPNALTVQLLNQQEVSCYQGNDGSLGVNASGGTAPYTYSWNTGNYAGASINGLSAGSYSVAITDNNGCIANGIYQITEPDELQVSITNQTNISCFQFNDGAIETSTIGGTFPYQYIWDNEMTTPDLSDLEPGTYTLIVTDVNGCADTLSTTIVEPDAIITSIATSSIICPGETTTIEAITTGGTGTIQYIWSNGANGSSQLVSPTQDTEYQVYSTDNNGCEGATVSTTVLVNQINLSTLTVAPDTAVCNGEEAIINASFIPGPGTYTYSWNHGVGTDLGPHIINPNQSTNYTITVTDDCGNTLSETISVTVNPIPNVQLSPQTSIGCGEAVFNLQNNFTYVAQDQYNWNFGDNTFSTSTTPEKVYTQTGVYDVMLIVTSAKGCINVANTTLNAVVNPKANALFSFSPNEEINTLNAKLYFTNATTNADAYQWSFGDGTYSVDQDPMHQYEEKGTYTITLLANNSYGCSDTYEEEITVYPAYTFYIPNAFTPDGDGLNDIFTAVGEEIVAFEMQIFNRWGEKIHETLSLNDGWDGSAKNGSEVVEQGVYVYNIQLKDYTGQLHRFTGKVTLLK